jgi:hypothetical protein
MSSAVSFAEITVYHTRLNSCSQLKVFLYNNAMKSFRLLTILLVIVLALFLAAVIFFRLREGSNYTIRTSKTTVIKELRSLNRLETAAFTIEKVIDAGTSGNRLQEVLFGDRILLIAHGEVIAGVDLSQLKERDIVINDRDIRLTLPPPRILVTSLDNEQTRVYDRKQGLLSRGDRDLESEARQAATDAIRVAACEGKILDEAANNARSQLTALFKTLQFTTITITIPQGSC